MYDENAEFDLTAVGPRYPSMRPEERGTWRVVLDNNEPVGVVWMMPAEPAGTGVVWLRQTDAVEKLRRHFVEARQAGTPASVAYNITDLLEGVRLSDEDSGPLSGVNDELTAMMEVL